MQAACHQSATHRGRASVKASIPCWKVGSCSIRAPLAESITTAAPLGKNRLELQPQRGGATRQHGRAVVPKSFLFGGGKQDDDDVVTVMKLHIAMFGDIKKHQAQLDHISDMWDSDDEDNMHGLLQGVLTWLLRNTQYCAYAAHAGRFFGDFDKAEQKFNSVCLEERAKFESETKVNVDGQRRKAALQSSSGQGADLDQWLCLTIVLAAEGRYRLSKVASVPDLKKVLSVLGGLSADDVVAMELLWTPQDQKDTYSKDELLLDYPTLVPLT